MRAEVRSPRGALPAGAGGGKKSQVHELGAQRGSWVERAGCDGGGKGVGRMQTGSSGSTRGPPSSTHRRERRERTFRVAPKQGERGAEGRGMLPALFPTHCIYTTQCFSQSVENKSLSQGVEFGSPPQQKGLLCSSTRLPQNTQGRFPQLLLPSASRLDILPHRQRK